MQQPLGNTCKLSAIRNSNRTSPRDPTGCRSDNRTPGTATRRPLASFPHQRCPLLVGTSHGRPCCKGPHHTARCHCHHQRQGQHTQSRQCTRCQCRRQSQSALRECLGPHPRLRTALSMPGLSAAQPKIFWHSTYLAIVAEQNAVMTVLSVCMPPFCTIPLRSLQHLRYADYSQATLIRPCIGNNELLCSAYHAAIFLG
jgi:hypothetical protein